MVGYRPWQESENKSTFIRCTIIWDCESMQNIKICLMLQCCGNKIPYSEEALKIVKLNVSKYTQWERTC